MRLTGDDLSAVRGLRTIFTDVSFSLEPGALLVVTGPNGVGKSTFLRIVAGLMEAAKGTVRLDPVPEEGIGPLIHYLGHLDGLKPSLSVGQNLDFWRRYWGGGEVTPVLETVGVRSLVNLPVAVLSAGQKRRTAMARLLLAERPIWLLDEPLTALDAAAESLFAELLSAHLGGGGMAIAATHRELPVAATARLVMEPAS